MARVVILHGRPSTDEYLSADQPSASNHHWLPWLQKHLLIAGHDVQTPEVFRAFDILYETWRQEFERHLVSEPMILVGHSCGAGFFVRWLSEHPHIEVSQLLLVAPWLNPRRSVASDFFDFTIDQSLPDRIGEIHLFHSRDDMAEIVESVAVIRRHLTGLIDHAYESMGHFCLDDMHTPAFPDLLAAIARAR